MKLIRLAFIGFVVLSVIYGIMSIYLRSVEREALEKRFDAGGQSGNRADFIAAGLRTYEAGLKKRLLWLIYIIPAVVMVIILGMQNFW